MKGINASLALCIVVVQLAIITQTATILVNHFGPVKLTLDDLFLVMQVTALVALVASVIGFVVFLVRVRAVYVRDREQGSIMLHESGNEEHSHVLDDELVDDFVVQVENETL